MPTLLDELIVQGVRQSLSHSLAQGLSGALAGSISHLAGAGMLSGLNFRDPGLAAAVAKAQGQLPTDPTAPAEPPSPAPSAQPPTEVAPITVTAPTPQPATGALGQALAGSAGADKLVGTSGADTVQPPTEVEPVTVEGKAQPPLANINPAALVIPAGAAGAALLASGGGGAATGAPQPTAPTTVDELTVTAPKPPPAPALDTTALPTTVAGLTTAVPDASGVTSGEPISPEHTLGPEDLVLPAAGVAGLVLNQPDASGVSADGKHMSVDPKDLIAGGLLAGGLAAGSGGTGAAGDALKGLADSSANLAGRLGNIASAGFAGDIGGRGLNSIGRMVRKAQAAIRQRYSNMGMSGSTAEMQDLQAAADAGVDLQFKVGQEMAVAGLNAIAALTGQSASIYTSLLNAQVAKNTALGNALANFAGALVRP